MQTRMEGEFRRGVVHGRATYYLDNGTRYYKQPKARDEQRYKVLQTRYYKQQGTKPSFSRFVGLFRKGVPHGRAVVIGEDGSQVRSMKLVFFFSFISLYLSFFLVNLLSSMLMYFFCCLGCCCFLHIVLVLVVPLFFV